MKDILNKFSSLSLDDRKEVVFQAYLLRVRDVSKWYRQLLFNRFAIPDLSGKSFNILTKVQTNDGKGVY